MGLVLDTGRFRLPIQTACVECSPLTVRHGAHCVGDQHVIVELRVQREQLEQFVIDRIAATNR